MASEEMLIATRVEKHQQLNGGKYPLTHSDGTISIQRMLYVIDEMTSLRDHFLVGGIKTTIDLSEVQNFTARNLRGRISAFRKSGALSFIKLTDETGHIQLVATRNNLSDYDNLKLLDLGDIVEVTGIPVLTKTGERSLLLSAWKLLTKCRRPLPEKFIGISDPELVYRKRYLDLMTSEESRARFIVRSALLRNLRKFMEADGFMEVETSTLSTVASGANAKPFTTHHNALDTDLRLRIAPELNLKRLLVGGFTKVYEIGRAYRNEGIDTRHNPEFTIMESYEAYGDFNRLIEFTKQLLNVDYVLEFNLPANVRQIYSNWKAQRTFTLSEFRQVSVYQAAMRALGKAGLSLSVNGCELMCDGCVSCEVNGFNVEDKNNPRLQKIDLEAFAKALAAANSPGDEWMVIFEHIAEPFLTEDYRTADDKYSVPVFITRYPKSVCPLARANDWRENECDRFELFVDGRELANAFQELNDPEEQAKRFQEQLQDNHKDAMDYDADYVEALEHGMPPAIGFGMGIDRLAMLLTNTTSIKDVILFPTLKPVKPEHVGDSTRQT